MSTDTPLNVSLVHGDLRQSDFPLVVGHYRRDVIVNAEAALDNALDGTLRRRFDLGVYPGPIGTFAIVRNTVRPKGAIVVGLGDVGELSADQLRMTFAIALRQYALEIAEDPGVTPTPGGYRSAAFSTLLVGTDGNGAGTLADSIYAILRGAVDANRSLRDAKLFDRVRIDSVEFIELYEDVACRAGHVIAQLPGPLKRDLQEGESIAGSREVISRTGGRFLRPPTPYDAGWWQRIAVHRKDVDPSALNAAVSSTQLTFTVLTDRARLEQDTVVGQRALVQKLMASATSRPDFDRELSATLYQLLIPEPVKDRLSQGRDVLFMVDRAGGGYPFELMAARGADGVIRPLAANHGMLRQFETEQYRTRPEMARSNKIFVLGNPKTLLWPDLPGAEQEAADVVAVARQHGLEPVEAPRADAERSVTLMMTGEYRVLHFAAHGQYDPDPMKSGVVISDTLFITPAEVAALPLVPELVFLNCCYLGALGQARPSSPDPRLASSLAEGFIQAGARAVIAAGWAVSDTAGNLFARTFYDAFFGGATFGDAVKTARDQTAKEFPNSSTWGAYQCYGNPHYRFSQRPQSGSADETFEVVTRMEALQSLQTLASTARNMTLDDSPWLARRFDALFEAIPSRWRDGGDLLTVCGEIAGELDQFDRAVEFYRSANKASTSSPLIAVEQLANLMARAAARRVYDKGPDPSTDTAFKEAEAWLDWLETRLPPTKERRALRGSLYKRMAISMPALRTEYLDRSRKAYDEAVELSGKATYQLLNLVALRFVVEGAKARKDLAQLIDSQAPASARAGADLSFWDIVGEPDTLLHKALIEGTFLASLEPVAASYERARRARPSPREWASVTDHIWFLATMTGDASLACFDKATSAALRTLLDRLVPAAAPGAAPAQAVAAAGVVPRPRPRPRARKTKRPAKRSKKR